MDVAGFCRRRFRVPPLACVFRVWYRGTHDMCAKVVKSSGGKKTVFFNIRLEPEMHRELTRRAKANERTVAGEIRAALRSYLEQAA
jgi:hypothetical protein